MIKVRRSSAPLQPMWCECFGMHFHCLRHYRSAYGTCLVLRVNHACRLFLGPPCPHVLPGTRILPRPELLVRRSTWDACEMISQPWPPPVLRTPRSKVYHAPSGSAAAGLGWSRRSQRSRKCCWQAERSVRETLRHLATNWWGVTGVIVAIVDATNRKDGTDGCKGGKRAKRVKACELVRPPCRAGRTRGIATRG